MRVYSAFLVSLMLLCSLSYAHEVTVGIDSLGNDYSRSDYIMSEDGGVMAGIVSRGLTLDKQVSSGYSELTQDSAGNLFYVFFTRGSKENLQTRWKYLEDYSFEKFYSPSFGFELISKNYIAIKAIYDSIDLLDDLRLSRGSYNLMVRYESINGTTPQVSVTKSS